MDTDSALAALMMMCGLSDDSDAIPRAAAEGDLSAGVDDRFGHSDGMQYLHHSVLGNSDAHRM